MNNKHNEQITTSPVPGTTLNFIKVEMVTSQLSKSKSNSNNKNFDKTFIIDTPGLLIPGSLTTILDPSELRLLLPRNNVEPFTFRVAPGKCIYFGGLGSIGLR